MREDSVFQESEAADVPQEEVVPSVLTTDSNATKKKTPSRRPITRSHPTTRAGRAAQAKARSQQASYRQEEKNIPSFQDNLSSSHKDGNPTDGTVSPGQAWKSALRKELLSLWPDQASVSSSRSGMAEESDPQENENINIAGTQVGRRR